jgi:hypothetical protein
MPETTKPKTQEEKDEERLRELEQKIKDVVDLMQEGVDREQMDKDLDEARAHHEKHKDNETKAFHKHNGSSKSLVIPTKTKSALDLIEKLKKRIRLGEHALNLHEALHRAASSQIDVLERCLKRARY